MKRYAMCFSSDVAVDVAVDVPWSCLRTWSTFLGSRGIAIDRVRANNPINFIAILSASTCISRPCLNISDIEIPCNLP